MKNKKFIILFLGIISCVLFASSLLADEPQKLIKEYVDRGLTILKDESLKGEEKAGERKKKLWKELSPIFDFEEMSQRALAQYWQKRTPEEKKEFVYLFTEILKDTYLGKTGTYTTDKVVILQEKQRGKYSIVQTKFILNSGKEASADFRLLNNDGKWKIYDVTIEGVSLVNNYRSQFKSILVRSSYEELIKMLKEKIADDT